MAKKDEEKVDDQESSVSPEETKAAAPPAQADTKSEKKKKFTRGSEADGNTYSTSFLQAKQSKDEDGNVVFVTEEACKARLGEMFDIDGTECVWDKDAVGFVAVSNKRYKKLMQAEEAMQKESKPKKPKAAKKKKSTKSKSEEPSSDEEKPEAMPSGKPATEV